jgi:hypothetical protein
MIFMLAPIAVGAQTISATNAAKNAGVLTSAAGMAADQLAN